MQSSNQGPIKHYSFFLYNKACTSLQFNCGPSLAYIPFNKYDSCGYTALSVLEDHSVTFISPPLR